jgi:hypothetical protein
MGQTHNLNSTYIPPRGFSFSGAQFYQNSLVIQPIFVPWWANRKIVRLIHYAVIIVVLANRQTAWSLWLTAEVKYQNLYFTKP